MIYYLRVILYYVLLCIDIITVQSVNIESIAIHEIGHVLMCLNYSQICNLISVDILPEELYLGKTIYIIKPNVYQITDILYGGVVAEQIIYNKYDYDDIISGDCYDKIWCDDMKHININMSKNYGRNILFNMFFGTDIMRRKISYDYTYNIFERNKELLIFLSEKLLKYNKLSADEIYEYIKEYQKIV